MLPRRERREEEDVAFLELTLPDIKFLIHTCLTVPARLWCLHNRIEDIISQTSAQRHRCKHITQSLHSQAWIMRRLKTLRPVLADSTKARLASLCLALMSCSNVPFIWDPMEGSSMSAGSHIVGALRCS